MERETGIEPVTSSLGKRSSFVNKGKLHWRFTLCIEIHGVSSGLVETRLNALSAFLKPGMLKLPKTSQSIVSKSLA
jgi:hypothetical protein